MTEDNKLFLEPHQPLVVNHSGEAIKCPPAGRPSIERSLDLQKEYFEIYHSRIIDGLNEEAVARARGISCGKVKNAVHWCRMANTGCSTVEELVDAVSRLDDRLQTLISKQNSIQKWLDAEYLAVDALPDATAPQFNQLKRLELLCRVFLMFEATIQAVLKEKHAMRRLLGNFVPTDPGIFNPEIQGLHAFAAQVKASGLTSEERQVISEILRKNIERTSAPT